MPTIAEAAQQLTGDGLPVLCIDTCVLLDIIRTPLRRISGCIQSAIELAEMQAQSRCRIVASSMIQNEWAAHEQAVMAELDRYLAARDQDAVAFHDACELVKVPVTFDKPSYQAAGLVAKLHELAADLLKNAIHLLPTDETKLKATNRNLAYVRPARKGSGPQDCIIIEEYFDLCRLLRLAGFAKKQVFCSSNTADYQDGPDLHEALTREFASLGLVFTNALHWAVNELKRDSLAPPVSGP